MGTMLNPYLSFRDDAREAMDFYQSVFGGEVTRMTFGDIGMAEDPADAQKVMHSMLVTDSGLALMCADTPSSMELTPGTNFAISLSGDDAEQLRRWWEGLSASGQIVQPLEPAPWGDTFGMCIDRFGVSWMVDITPPAAA